MPSVEDRQPGCHTESVTFSAIAFPEVVRLPLVPQPRRYLSIGDVAKRWDISEQGTHKRLTKAGLLTADRKTKGGYIFTLEEIEGVERALAKDLPPDAED